MKSLGLLIIFSLLLASCGDKKYATKEDIETFKQELRDRDNQQLQSTLCRQDTFILPGATYFKATPSIQLDWSKSKMECEDLNGTYQEKKHFGFQCWMDLNKAARYQCGYPIFGTEDYSFDEFIKYKVVFNSITEEGAVGECYAPCDEVSNEF